MNIRYMEIPEINKVIDLWLEVNIEVHHKIDKEYWLRHKDEVKESMENSNIYIMEHNKEIVGFAGVTEGYYLAGIFIDKNYRSQGYGKSMIDYLKLKYDELILDVYEFNEEAIKFYEREDFGIIEININEELQINEKTMAWPKEI